MRFVTDRTGNVRAGTAKMHDREKRRSLRSNLRNSAGTEFHMVRSTVVKPHLASFIGVGLARRISSLCQAAMMRRRSLAQQASVQADGDSKGNKDSKQDSKQSSNVLFQQGKDIAAIAAERGLASSTIEGHLAHNVAAGKLDIHELVAKEKVTMIQQAITAKSDASLSQLKAHLGADCSYGDIRLVQASLN